MDQVSLNSFAKINIGLQIRGKRNDGYHNIHTIFQTLNLHDTLTIKKSEKGCDFSSNVGWLKNDDSNLCVKAWNTMAGYFKLGGISIDLDKRIPPGSGLGGGSSNAATVMKGICDIYDLKISNEEMESIAVTLGADVSFFLYGGTQIGNGIGEKLTPIETFITGTILLVIPDVHIDTKWAYEQCKIILEAQREKVNFAGFVQKEKIPFELFENDFEAIVVPAYPEIGIIKDSLRAAGARFTSLSGSGSTVFGIFDNETDALSAESQIPNQYHTFISHPRP